MKRRPWTSAQVRTLRKLYPHMRTDRLAKRMRMTLAKVYNKAFQLGLHKSARYLAGPDACRLRRGDNVGAQYRFKKGLQPWNAGLHYLPGGRCKEGWFKKGAKPWTWVPVGSRRVTKDGILQQKVSDTGYPPRDWKAVHAILWAKKHGKIKRGHIVVFKDRNRRNFKLSNLECISRAENMQRNTYHRYPKEIALLIQLRGALNRQINKRGGQA